MQETSWKESKRKLNKKLSCSGSQPHEGANTSQNPCKTIKTYQKVNKQLSKTQETIQKKSVGKVSQKSSIFKLPSFS